MSKRVLVQVDNDIQAVEIPAEIWFIIGQYIPWYETGSLLAFLAVSQSAIRFVQTPIRTLVANILSSGYTHRLLDTLTHEFRNEPKVEKALRKCLTKYYANTEGTPREWREQSAVILSIIQLSQLRSEYLSVQDPKPYTRISSEIPRKSKLRDVYFCPGDGKNPTTIDRLRITHVVDGMSCDKPIFAEAVATIKKTLPASQQQEMYLYALHHSFGNEAIAVAYYAMAKILSVRMATPDDMFYNVVLVNPHVDGEFLHIYSRYNTMVKTFHKSCLIYKGEPNNASIAFHLHFNQTQHHESCIKQCKRISRFL